MIINEKNINERYKQNIFINSPNFESNIQIILDKIVNENISPFFSIVIPIHNQESIIVKNIQSVLNNTSEKYYEIILIIDACSDNTELNLLNWIQNINLENFKLLNKIIILKSEIPLFETSADNLGFFCSSGEYILEIQSDMEMIMYGYNMKLLIPFLKNDQIIGISGRCCHNYKSTIGCGKLGLDCIKNLIDLPNIDINSYYIGETCNRGPLLLNKHKLKELGFLDEVNYFLDNSDHDLFARAFFTKKWICGYVPIDVYSPLEDGSTRKPRNILNQKYYNIKIQLTQNSINGFLKKNINNIPYRDIIQYNLYTD
jgi:glycosyltransferase involved in cell wall biosynthesis